MSVIKVSNLTKKFGDTFAVDNISFEVKKGEIFAILGPSGCGKTTTLRLIAGFEDPDDGGVYIEGTLAADKQKSTPPENRAIGMVFQDYALFPHLSVEKNILFGLERFPREQRSRIVINMLEFVGLQGFHDRYPHQLSGGQQQRVALARAMAPCPVVVLLDEPLSNLDADMRMKMRKELLQILKRAQTTTILVTHDQEEAFTLADNVAVLNNGMLEQLGTPEEIYHSPATRFVADFVGQADFINGLVKDNRIVTEIGTFQDKSNFEEGSHVQLMIRPDDILFIPDNESGSTIVSREFRGEENRYTLKLPSGKIVHSSRPSTEVIKEGTNVRVEANPMHIVAFLAEYGDKQNE